VAPECFNPGWHLARDLKSMLTVSEAVTRSALARRESRGAHSRIDCPNLDAAWGKQNWNFARCRCPDAGGFAIVTC
jgi:succinate dehydrogenase/fumarate reductase flavoprotein subunit